MSVAMVRELDQLGRYCIPREILNRFGLERNVDFLEFFKDENEIILKKYISADSCFICEEIKDSLKTFKNKYICKECINQIVNGKGDKIHD